MSRRRRTRVMQRGASTAKTKPSGICRRRSQKFCDRCRRWNVPSIPIAVNVRAA
jgi:hypothetical protein